MLLWWSGVVELDPHVWCAFFTSMGFMWCPLGAALWAQIKESSLCFSPFQSSLPQSTNQPLCSQQRARQQLVREPSLLRCLWDSVEWGLFCALYLCSKGCSREGETVCLSAEDHACCVCQDGHWMIATHSGQSAQAVCKATSSDVLHLGISPCLLFSLFVYSYYVLCCI